MPLIHNGKITLKNQKGEHRTFSIKTTKKESKLEGKRIIALLVGPDNTDDYKAFGFVDETGVKVWKKFSQDKSFLWYAELVNVLLGKLPSQRDARIFEGYTVYESRRCLRCNRELTTPESIESGYGPVCNGIA